MAYWSPYGSYRLEALLEADEVCWCGPVKLAVLGGARTDLPRFEQKAAKGAKGATTFVSLRFLL